MKLNTSDITEVDPSTSSFSHKHSPTTTEFQFNVRFPIMLNPYTLGISVDLKPTVRPLVIWPDERLSQVCDDVTEFDNDLGQLIADMAETLKHHNGLGLAAPQVGETVNVILVVIGEYPHQTTEVLINPKIVKQDDKKYSTEEGCLSVPGYFEKRKRPSSVVVEYNLPDGRKKTTKYEGMWAFVVQHEIDHINGKVFIDGLSSFKQSRVKKKITKTLRGK